MNLVPEQLRETPVGRTRRPATQDEILEAALALFAIHGYRGTTISAIAAEVGISAPGVMHHFPTKERLFWAVVEVYTEAWAGRLAEMIEPGGLNAIRNLAGWGAVMEERSDLVGLQVILSAEAISQDADTHDYWAVRYQNLQSVVADLFQQGIEKGELVKPEVQDAYVEGMCAAGKQVDYRKYEGKDHVPLVETDSPLIPELIEWTHARLDGEEPISTC